MKIFLLKIVESFLLTTCFSLTYNQDYLKLKAKYP